MMRTLLYSSRRQKRDSGSRKVCLFMAMFSKSLDFPSIRKLRTSLEGDIFDALSLGLPGYFGLECTIHKI